MAEEMKKRILFVTQTREYGGTEKFLLDLISRLNLSAADCTILCYASDVFSSRLVDRSHVQIVTHKRTDTFLSYWFIFLHFRPHIIFFVKGIFNHYPWYAHLAARISGARRFFVIEQLIADPAPEKISGGGLRNSLRQLFGWRVRYMLRVWLQARLSHKTICVSNAIRERLVYEYRYPEKKTITIWNSVDLKYYDSANEMEWENISESLDVDSRETIILCVARLSRVKRIDILLDALSIVVKDYSSWKCLILGSGPLEEELRAHSAALGLSEKVMFVGHVGDIRPYLKIADLFVLSSEKEGLPLALLEAMAFEVPCIATDVGGNKEAIVHGQTGTLVKFGSAEQLAQAIDYFLVHGEERHRMGKNGKNRVREYFDIDQNMGKIVHMMLDNL